MVAGVCSDDMNLQLEATTQFRKLLSIGKFSMSCWNFVCFVLAVISRITCFAMNVLPERSPPINEVVQSGVVPRFVEFLARDEFPQLQVRFFNLCYSFWYWIHVCYLCRFMFVDFFLLWSWMYCSVWGSLGPNKYCFWDVGKHQGCNWSWSHPDICQTFRLSSWWCSRAGVYF